MLETVEKRKLDLIKWMDITRTRTNKNTSWNLTESSSTDVYTVTMPARSTRSMVWAWVIYTNEPWRRNDTLESGNASSTEKFGKTTLYETLQQSEMINPLEPRDAFYEGRIEAFTLFQKDQDISYVDVTSLYSYINKTGKIPIGHLEIVTEGFTDIQQYEGLIKCKIFPPRGLYIPVLPVKMNNKLLFTLCRTCSENHQQTSCQHNDEERSLTGTWVTDELKKALEKGYAVQRIYEV